MTTLQTSPSWDRLRVPVPALEVRLLRPALKDRPQGPSTANHQPLPTAANRCQPPTTNRCQPPPTANRQPPDPLTRTPKPGLGGMPRGRRPLRAKSSVGQGVEGSQVSPRPWSEGARGGSSQPRGCRQPPIPPTPPPPFRPTTKALCQPPPPLSHAAALRGVQACASVCTYFPRSQA